MVDKKDIKENLIKLGLEEHEASVYIELVNSGPMSILELSKALNIPRTTVYRLSQKLIDKRFGEWIVKENNLRIKAVKPKDLNYLVDEKKTELQIYKESLDSLKTMVTDDIHNLPKTEVRYYQGREGLRQIMWNSLKAEGELLGYSVYGRKEVVGQEFNDKWVKEFKLRKLRDRTVINEEGLEYFKKYITPSWHQQGSDDMRFISESKFYIKGDISIYNNIYAVSFWREGEVVGIEIENSEIAKNQKSIFEILWSIAEPVNKLID